MTTEVDQAFARYELLMRLVIAARDRAYNQPTSDWVIDNGLLERGERSDTARAKLRAKFDQLTALIERQGLLDVCSAFEAAVKKRISSAIGEARKVVKANYAIRPFSQVAEGLVREKSSFESLDAIFSWLVPESEAALGLRDIRLERNRIAHTSDTDGPLRVAVQDARDKLNELMREHF